MDSNRDRTDGQIALFTLLAAGERLAERAARREAILVDEPRLAALFHRQAEQERNHARIFDLVLRHLGRRSVHAADPAASVLARRIDVAADRADLAGMVVATQGVLEGIGVAALEAMNLDQHPRGHWLVPFHRLVLAQERAHQRIGERALAHLVASEQIGWTAIEVALGAALADGLDLIDRHAHIAARLDKPIHAMRQAVRRHAERFLDDTRRLAGANP